MNDMWWLWRRLITDEMSQEADSRDGLMQNEMSDL